MKSAAQEVGSVGSRLIAIRGGRSQPDRASDFGVHKNTYARWERDEASMPAEGLTTLVTEGWNANWVLTGDGAERLSQFQVADDQAGYGSQEMSGEKLSVAAELADEALTGLWLPRRRYYDLVGLIYDALVQGLPYAEIIAFARPAAKQMAGDKSDDGGAEVGGEGAGTAGRGQAAGDT